MQRIAAWLGAASVFGWAALADEGGHMRAAEPAIRAEHQAQVWQPVEFVFTARGTYERPCVDVELAADFKGPDGVARRCTRR
jgi:hypothetical protein